MEDALSPVQPGFGGIGWLAGDPDAASCFAHVEIYPATMLGAALFTAGPVADANLQPGQLFMPDHHGVGAGVLAGPGATPSQVEPGDLLGQAVVPGPAGWDCVVQVVGHHQPRHPRRQLLLRLLGGVPVGTFESEPIVA